MCKKSYFLSIISIKTNKWNLRTLILNLQLKSPNSLSTSSGKAPSKGSSPVFWPYGCLSEPGALCALCVAPCGVFGSPAEQVVSLSPSPLRLHSPHSGPSPISSHVLCSSSHLPLELWENQSSFSCFYLRTLQSYILLTLLEYNRVQINILWWKPPLPLPRVVHSTTGWCEK